MKSRKKYSTIFIINRIVIILLVTFGFSVAFNYLFNINLRSATSARHDLTYYANSFMDGSSKLTREVRLQVATGDETHYEHYIEELDSNRRQISVKKLKEIGITKEETTLIEEMAGISDELVPYELEAMRLRSAGDNEQASEIVFGTFYIDKINRIAALKNEFLTKLDERTTENVNRQTVIYDIVNIATLAIMISTIIMQIVQKRALYRLAYVDQLTNGNNYTAFREKMRSGTDIGGNGYILSADLKDFSTLTIPAASQKATKSSAEWVGFSKST